MRVKKRREEERRRRRGEGDEGKEHKDEAGEGKLLKAQAPHPSCRLP